MKMSYKAAWDTVDIMNNLSEYPLVNRVKGGKGGGGTVLTPYANELISAYNVLQEEHHKFLHNLSKRMQEHDGHFRLLESMNVRISARNQLRAKVVEIHKGAVESEIFLQHQDEDKGIFIAIITNDSVETLDLKVGNVVHALFKANAVTISLNTKLKGSDKNCFMGTVNRISRGNFDAEVVVEFKNGNTICSTMSVVALEELKLQKGTEVVAFCEPSSIIIGMW